MLDAAAIEQAVVREDVDGRQQLVLEEAHVEVGRFERLALLDQVGALLQRLGDGGFDVDVARVGRRRRRVGQVDVGRPVVGRRRVEDQAAQVVFGQIDLRGGQNRGLFVARDFGFGADDVDRRHGADFDARPVVAERLAREVERLLRHAQIGARVDQIPVGVAHLTGRLDDRLLQRHVGDLALLARDEQVRAVAVREEITEQRLRHVERHRRAERRIERLVGRVRRAPIVLPADAVIGAVPGQRLLDARVRA